MPLQACVWRVLLGGLEAGHTILRHWCGCLCGRAALLWGLLRCNGHLTCCLLQPAPMPPLRPSINPPTFCPVPRFPCGWNPTQARPLCSSWRHAPRPGSGGGAAWPGSTTITSSGARPKPSPWEAQEGERLAAAGGWAVGWLAGWGGCERLAAVGGGLSGWVGGCAVRELFLGLAGRALQLHALPSRPPPATCLARPRANSGVTPGATAPLPSSGPPCRRYALWLDADLTSGISRNSTTFGNNSLAGAEEFSIGAVELWGLS